MSGRRRSLKVSIKMDGLLRTIDITWTIPERVFTIMVQIFSYALALFVAASPVASTLTIESVSYNGTACPAGSLTYDLEPTRLNINPPSPPRNVYWGPNVPAADRKKDCSWSFKVGYSGNWGQKLSRFCVTDYYFGLAILDSGLAVYSNATVSVGSAERKNWIAFWGPTSAEIRISYLLCVDVPESEGRAGCSNGAAGRLDLKLDSKLEIKEQQYYNNAPATPESVGKTELDMGVSYVGVEREEWKNC